MKYVFGCVVAGSAMLGLANAALADPTPLPSNRNIDIQMSNDAGALYGSGPNDTYFLNAPGGGLNQLHITTDGSAAGVSGQVTSQNIAASSTSGSFFVSTTGGRGYNDDIIIGFSLRGPISNDFSLKVTSSGYQWTPSTAGPVNPVYKAGAASETFTKADFLYGPQTAKPGPGNGWTLPFQSGQDINDPTTAQYLMFIDLDVGNDNIRSAIDSGDAKIEFDLSGIYDTTACFNAYAWTFSANVADSSINWTNNLSTDPSAPGQSGYCVATTAMAVPEPGQGALFALGVSAIFWAQRRRQA
jgi:hypothetical protein